MTLTAVYLALRTTENLGRALSCFYKNNLKNSEVFVIFNECPPVGIKELCGLYPDVKPIIFEKNMGFSYSANRAIEKSAGEAIFLCNDDVFIEKDFFLNILPVLDEKGKVGAAMGKLYRNEEMTVLDSIGLGWKLFPFRPIDLGTGKKERPGDDKRKQVFGPNGAAPVYLKKALEEIKIEKEYFDEDFFSFLEDVDLAWRLKKRGWKTIYEPQARGVHFRQSLSRKDTFLDGGSFRNYYLLLIKNLRLPALVVFLPYLFFDLFYKILKKTRKKEFWVYKSVADIFCKIPVMLRKRSLLRKSSV